MKRLIGSLVVLHLLASSAWAGTAGSYSPLPAASGGGGGGTVTDVTGTNGIACTGATSVSCSGTALLLKASNLSDLPSASTARTNLGLATVASSGSAADLGSGTLPVARSIAYAGGDVTSSAGSAVLTIGAGAVTLAKQADVATARIMGRLTAGTGSQEALTAAQAQQVLFGALASGLHYGTTTTGAVTAITTTTGLTVTSSALTNNLITGLAGGQTIIGGTASGEGITYSSTSHASKGLHAWGGPAQLAFNESWSTGTATPGLTMGVTPTGGLSGLGASVQIHRASTTGNTIWATNNSTGASVQTGYAAGNGAAGTLGSNYYLFTLQGTNFTTIGPLTANSMAFEHVNATSAPMVFSAYSGGDIIFANTTSRTERLRIENAGLLKFGAASMTANASAATALTSVGPAGASTTVQEWLTIKNSAGTTRYIPAFYADPRAMDLGYWPTCWLRGCDDN